MDVGNLRSRFQQNLTLTARFIFQLEFGIQRQLIIGAKYNIMYTSKNILIKIYSLLSTFSAFFILILGNFL